MKKQETNNNKPTDQNTTDENTTDPLKEEKEVNIADTEKDLDDESHKALSKITSDKDDPDDRVHNQKTDSFDASKEQDLDDLVHSR